MLTLLSLDSMVPMILLATGITSVITGSKIGYPIRLSWCALFQWKPLRSLWHLVRCPYCNAWWTGGAIALLFDANFIQALQVAFTTCGLIKILQVALGDDGIAMVEDFEGLFDEEEENEYV